MPDVVKQTKAVPRDRQILDAARSLFFERGFHAVGINEIAEKAGVVGSAVYRYFSSKDEILERIFEEALDVLFDELSRGETGSPDPLEELTVLVRIHARFVIAQQDVAMIMIRDESSLAPTYRRRHNRRVESYVDRWIDCLRRAFPDRDPAEAVTATAATLSLLNSVGYWPPAARTVADLPALLVELAMGALGALASQEPEGSDGLGLAGELR